MFSLDNIIVFFMVFILMCIGGAGVISKKGSNVVLSVLDTKSQTLRTENVYQWSL